MGSLVFFAKTLVLTIILVLILQVRWDRATLEEHAMVFITESAIVQPVNNVAQSFAKFVRNAWNSTMQTIDTNFTRALQSESRPGQRQLKFNMERSKDYLSQRTKEAKVRAKEGYDYAREEARIRAAQLKAHLKEEGVIEEAEE